MYLETKRPGIGNEEFSETRIGPVSDSIIELLKKLPLNEEMEIDEGIRKEIMNHVKAIDPDRGEELRELFGLTDEVNFYTGFTENRFDPRDEVEMKRLKEILVSSDLASETIYQNLLAIEEMLAGEVDVQAKEQAEREIQDEKNKRRAA